MNSLIPVNGIEVVPSTDSLNSGTPVSSDKLAKRLSKESLALENLDELEDILFEQQLATASSTPSLYTAEKSKMVKPSQYHYDFLSGKRPGAVVSLNPQIQEVEKELDACLKEKIQATVEARTVKIFKKQLPDTEQLKGEAEEHEIAQFISDIQEFQRDYREFVLEQNDNLITEEKEFWEQLIPEEGKRERLKKAFIETVEKNEALFKTNPTDVINKFKGGLYRQELFDLISDNPKEIKRPRVEEIIKKFTEHFAKNSPIEIKKARQSKLEELYEQLKIKNPANDKLLKKSIQTEFKTVARLFEELASEHQAHAFGRFTKLFSCHADFVNSMVYLMKRIETKAIQPAVIQDIVVTMLSNAYLDEEEEASTRDQYYRVVQGRGEGKKGATAEDKLFNDKMRSVFSKVMRNNQFIPREDSHTIPFPGAFSWSVEKLQKKFEEKSITVSAGVPDRHITSQAFEEFNAGKLDKNRLIQDALEQLESEISADEGEFMREALLIVMKLALIQASETETMPSFINQRLDRLSEARLKDEELIKSDSGRISSSSTTSTESSSLAPLSTSSSSVIERDYKKLLGKNLAKLVEDKQEVDFATVFKEHQSYVEQTLVCLNYRITELTQKSVQNISLDNLYELRLICDIWAAIENAEAEAKHSISPCITPKWHHLKQWIAA